MGTKVKVACIQYACDRGAVSDKEQVRRSIEKAGELVREAAASGAQIILLSELFERKYFCQERRYDYYAYAVPAMENQAV